MTAAIWGFAGTPTTGDILIFPAGPATVEQYQQHRGLDVEPGSVFVGRQRWPYGDFWQRCHRHQRHRGDEQRRTPNTPVQQHYASDQLATFVVNVATGAKPVPGRHNQRHGGG